MYYILYTKITKKKMYIYFIIYIFFSTSPARLYVAVCGCLLACCRLKSLRLSTTLCLFCIVYFYYTKTIYKIQYTIAVLFNSRAHKNTKNYMESDRKFFFFLEKKNIIFFIGYSISIQIL